MFTYVPYLCNIKVYKPYKDYDPEYFGFFSNYDIKEWKWTARDCKSLSEAELTEIFLKLKELNDQARRSNQLLPG